MGCKTGWPTGSPEGGISILGGSCDGTGVGETVAPLPEYTIPLTSKSR